MKLQIGGAQYDWNESLSKAKLHDLLDLSKAAGIGERSIRTVLQDLFSVKDRTEAAALGERPETITAMLGLVFLCKRHSDEPVEFATLDVSYDDLQWILEDGDLADPTSASGDQTPPSPETENESASKTRAHSAPTSKPSKARSTTAS